MVAGCPTRPRRARPALRRVDAARLVDQVRRLRDHRAGRQRHHRVLEHRRRAAQGLHRRGGDRPQLLDVLHRRGPARRAAAAAARRGPRQGSRREPGLAGAQGRHPVLGRRRHHRPARRRRHLTGFGKVTRDLTAQHELEESLRRSEERFRLLVSQVKDYAIIALDASGTIESWNAGAERVKGYTADEAIGHSFSMFYTAEDRRAGLPLRAARRGPATRAGSSTPAGGCARTAPGSGATSSSPPCATTAATSPASPRSPATCTERKELEDAQASFLAADRPRLPHPDHRDEGVHRADRATPPSELRRVPRADRRQRRPADADDEGPGRLRDAALGHDVVPRPRCSTWPTLARATVSAMGSTLRMSTGSRCPRASRPVVADRASMERVLTNLVEQRAQVLRRRTGRHRRHPVPTTGSGITVTDEGRGIAPEDLDTIFDEFERGRLAEDDGGTGLGPDQRQAPGRGAGRPVDIDSTLGQGTTVTVELPAPARRRRPRPASGCGSSASSSGR